MGPTFPTTLSYVLVPLWLRYCLLMHDLLARLTLCKWMFSLKDAHETVLLSGESANVLRTTLYD